MTGERGILGLSSQTESRISGMSTTLRKPSESSPQRASRISASPETDIHLPSTATILAFAASHCGTVSTPSMPILCSSTPVPASWEAACMKYLESVHSPAWEAVSTNVPASPVKPVSHSICFHRGAGYSLECGSDAQTTRASHPFENIISRTRAILSEQFIFPEY